ncbi:MAG TPA: hypothetical protein VD789_12190 [Thermomicrobiales bacterium]|nr:hypothetical protein [Thermomicrobiales bacterium]
MIEFHVIGELRHDPGHLLLLDADGQCYDYDVSMSEIIPVEPDGTWAVDVIEEGRLVMVAPEEKIVTAQPATTKVS